MLREEATDRAGEVLVKYDDFVHTVERELEQLGYDELGVIAAEPRHVLIWRAVQFAELGFETKQAVSLAQAAVDLGRARRLMAAGCTVETAARILL